MRVGGRARRRFAARAAATYAIGGDAARRGPRRAPRPRRPRPTARRARRCSRSRSATMVGAGAVGVGPPLLQDAERHGVERAGFDVVAQPEATQPAAQLAGGLAGERQGQRVTGVGGAGRRCDRRCDGSSTRVLPEPAAAMTATSVDGVMTAARWRSSRSASRACASIAVTLWRAATDAAAWRRRSPRARSRSRRCTVLLPTCRIRRSCSTTTRSSRSTCTRTGGTSPRRSCALVVSIALGIFLVAVGAADWLKWVAVVLIVAERAVDARPLLQVADHELRHHQRPGHLPARAVRQERHRDPARARQQRALQPGDPRADARRR